MPVITMVRGLGLLALLLLPLAPPAAAAGSDAVRSFGQGAVSFTQRAPSAQQEQEARAKAYLAAIRKWMGENRPSGGRILSRCGIDNATVESFLLAAPRGKRKVEKIDKKTKRLVYGAQIVFDSLLVDEYLLGCVRQSDKVLAVLLVARQNLGTGAVNTYKSFYGQLDSVLAAELVARGINVNSGQDMQLYAGGLYRKGRLVDQYAYSGQVNFEPADIAARMIEVDAMLIGYFDIESSGKHERTGNYSVYVSGSAQVYDIHSRGVYASTSKIRMEGNHRNPQQAIREAVSLTARAVGVEIADQLNLKSLAR